MPWGTEERKLKFLLYSRVFLRIPRLSTLKSQPNSRLMIMLPGCMT